jgi:hypothetical protein
MTGFSESNLPQRHPDNIHKTKVTIRSPEVVIVNYAVLYIINPINSMEVFKINMDRGVCMVEYAALQVIRNRFGQGSSRMWDQGYVCILKG